MSLFIVFYNLNLTFKVVVAAVVVVVATVASAAAVAAAVAAAMTHLNDPFESSLDLICRILNSTY